MILRKHIKIFDKNIVFFSPSPIYNKWTCLSSQHWYIDWMFFFVFTAKNTNFDRIIFFYFMLSLSLTGNFMCLKSSFFAKSLSAFVIILWLWSVGFKYMTKPHLKHSLSSIFWILINRFLGGFNSFSNLI